MGRLGAPFSSGRNKDASNVPERFRRFRANDKPILGEVGAEGVEFRLTMPGFEYSGEDAASFGLGVGMRRIGTSPVDCD